MSLKGIQLLALALLSAVSARAIEQHLVLYPGRSDSPASQNSLGIPRSIGNWTADGVTLKAGFQGGEDYVLLHAAYAPDANTDLLLHLDQSTSGDSSGNWDVTQGADYEVDRARALLGEGAGSFRGPGSALRLAPRPTSLFASGSRFRDFSLEFWLYPANAENGEVVLLWQSVRKLPAGVLPQQISCVIAGGRLLWTFSGFFAPPGAQSPGPAATSLQLRARSPLVPRVWSHHLIHFDGDTGLLEYLVDGKPEADTYATASGREGGTVFEPAIGAAAALKLCPEYAGLLDELRLSRSFVERPNLRPYGRDGALIVSPVADLGYAHSRLLEIDAQFRSPGTTGIELSYRIADDWSRWRLDSPAWIPLRPGEALPGDVRGRYVQLRAELFPDGSGTLSPSLSSLTLSFEQDPPPPPPARLIATAKDGAIQLRWTRVPEADLAGYLVYYGEESGSYFGTGADQGPSPIDAGNTGTITITGIPDGKLLYFAVAAYDGAALSAPGGPPSRAGETSEEVAARPTRTP
ncbi:MAG TPA: hypothetical protein VMC79_16625 [Rectinemataceae bacterium]|nr:hypothetical protein [Rectinemataceae bacterium]